jgi:hypothetical protein
MKNTPRTLGVNIATLAYIPLSLLVLLDFCSSSLLVCRARAC